MSYVIYALFKVPGAAESALQDLAAADLPRDSYQVFIHKKEFPHDLRTSESDGRKGLFIGVGVGALAGALFGWLLCGPLGFLQLPVVSAVGLGMFLGIICGVLGGGIYGTGLAHRNLDRLIRAFRPGHTLVTAEMETLQSRSVVEQIFRKHGAIAASPRRRSLNKLPLLASDAALPPKA